MLKKLLKYDLLNIYKFISIFYILTMIFAIITRILFSIKQTVFVSIIGQVSVGCLYSMMASSIINTFMRNWVRLKESVYGDESYLTHTLPVTKKEICQSKFLLTLINLITTFIVVIIGLFIAYYTKDKWQIFIEYIKSIAKPLNMSTFKFVALIIIVTFVEVLNMIESGIFGIITGHRKNNHKILFSLAFGLITYFLSQIIIVVVMLIIGLFDSNIMMMFTSNTMDVAFFEKAMIITIIIYIIINILIYITSVKFLNKGVNVD